jgi:hypothetical protein
MKKLAAFIPVLLVACMFITPKPNDFPPPPPTLLTRIVELPPVTSAPTLEIHPRPIMQSDMSDAQTFLLIIKTQIAAGDYHGFAENVHYPINVDLEGKMKTFTTPDDLAENFKSVLNDRIVNALNETNEDELIILPEGIRVGQGEIWFNLFCVDAACADTQFLITQINK